MYVCLKYGSPNLRTIAMKGHFFVFDVFLTLRVKKGKIGDLPDFKIFRLTSLGFDRAKLPAQ